MKKCPRCELNYIADDEKYCKVCIREMKGGQKHDDIEPCSVCNAAPALPGKDLCLGCYKELHGHHPSDRKHDNAAEDDIELSDTRVMGKILPNVNDDDDEHDFDDEDDELSLETIIEDEDHDDDDEEDVYN